jgi:hypothetical protein
MINVYRVYPCKEGAVADLEIDFENAVGKYEFRPATPERICRWKKHYPHEETPEDYVGEIVCVGPTKMVRPKADKMEWAVRLLLERKRVPVPFHKLALKIVQAIGLHRDQADWVADWHFEANHLQEMFEGKGIDFLARRPGREVRWPHPAAQQVGQLGIFLIPSSEGKRVLALKPESLSDALTLYGARMLATGTTFNACEHCRAPFLSGGTGRANKKRGGSRFCSDKCRYSYHNEANRKLRG